MSRLSRLLAPAVVVTTALFVMAAPSVVHAGIPFNAIGELVATPLLYQDPYDSPVVATGDVDGDGLDDLLAGVFSGSYSVVLNHGDGTFGASHDLVVGFTPSTEPLLVDLNHDGRSDLLMGSSSGQLVTMLGNGDGTFGSSLPTALSGAPSQLAVGDLDGDHDVDAVASIGSSVSILLGNGDGTFTPTPDVSNAGGVRSLALSDFNRDGRLDLAVLNQSRLVAVRLGTGDGTFPTETSWDSNSNATELVAGDVDGDGFSDLIVIGTYGPPSVSRGHGDGAFDAAVITTDYEIWAFVQLQLVATGDLTGDGRLDFVVVAAFHDQPGYDDTKLKLLNGDSSGLLHVTRTIQPMPVDDFNHFVPYAAGVITDLNGDDRPDIAIGGLNGNAVLELSPRPDGTFQQPAARSYRNPYYYVAVTLVTTSNVDGDSHPDLLTGYSNGYGGATVTIERTAASTVSYTLAFYPLAAAAGDLDGDGTNDLVYLGSSTDNVSMLGTPGGSFGPQVPFTTGPDPGSVVIADLDGDHHGDLVVTSSLGLTWQHGYGDGTFGSPITLLTDPTGRVRAADLNGDHRPELVCPTSAGVTLLIGGGGWNVVGRADLSPAGAVADVAVGDLNADGVADLAATLDTGIAVWLGSGGGDFGPVSFTPGLGTGLIAIGDWNLDDLPDLAFTSVGVTYVLGHGDGTFGTRRNMAPYMDGMSDLVNLSPDAAGKPRLVTRSGPGIVFLTGRPDPIDPVVHVTFPNGGETVLVPRYVNVTWTSSDNVGVTSVDVRLSRHGASGPWETLAHAVPNTGTFTWFISGPLTEQALISVRGFDAAGNFASDVSDQAFAIRMVDDVESSHAPDRFALSPVTPSPAHSIVRFTFDVPRASDLRLDVVDVTGRVVGTLRRGSLAAGRYSEEWRAANGRERLPAGVYFVRLTAAGESFARKVILVP